MTAAEACMARTTTEAAVALTAAAPRAGTLEPMARSPTAPASAKARVLTGATAVSALVHPAKTETAAVCRRASVTEGTVPLASERGAAMAGRETTPGMPESLMMTGLMASPESASELCGSIPAMAPTLMVTHHSEAGASAGLMSGMADRLMASRPLTAAAGLEAALAAKAALRRTGETLRAKTLTAPSAALRRSREALRAGAWTPAHPRTALRLTPVGAALPAPPVRPLACPSGR